MKKIIFSSAKNLEVPTHNLNEIQIESFRWWQEKGLKELFEEISPIKDYTGKEFELYFNDYHFDEPKYSEREARENGTTYQASLRVNCTLINHVAKEKKEQEVYLGEYPLITEKGIFIINGVGRVVVSQIIRSSGVYFVATPTRDKKLFGAKIIPNRGCWLEFETENDGVIYVRIDKKRKIPATALLRVFGLVTNEEILKRFSDVDKGSIKYIERTLKKDASF
ncbi:DNA-directed RNA polymerase subunit beta, partial [bacterium]|nr:DNA-directed RNA polymerase subunit beta [bacterium]